MSRSPEIESSQSQKIILGKPFKISPNLSQAEEEYSEISLLQTIDIYIEQLRKRGRIMIIQKNSSPEPFNNWLSSIASDQAQPPLSLQVEIDDLSLNQLNRVSCHVIFASNLRYTECQCTSSYDPDMLRKQRRTTLFFASFIDPDTKEVRPLQFPSYSKLFETMSFVIDYQGPMLIKS